MVSLRVRQGGGQIGSDGLGPAFSFGRRGGTGPIESGAERVRAAKVGGVRGLLWGSYAEVLDSGEGT